MRRAVVSLVGFALVEAALAGGIPGTITEQQTFLEVYGVNLPVAITSPKEGKPLASVLIIPGSFFNDVDGNYPEILRMRPHTYADLARQLSELGYRVLRYAKHGPGTGSVERDRNLAKVHTTFQGRVLIAKEILRQFVTEDLTRQPTFIAGHSEGGLVASILAAECLESISGVIQLSAPAFRFFELQLRQAEFRNKMEGPSAEGKAQALKEFQAAIELVRNGDTLPEGAFSNPHLFGYKFLSREAWAYLQEMDRADPSELITLFKQPVLIAQGSMDDSVNVENAEVLHLARGQTSSEVAIFQDLQHFFKKVQWDKTPADNFTLETETDPSVAVTIDNWISKVVSDPAVR